MVREFKKTGVAVALTGALLATASMTSQASLQLTVPGDVVLVPYVVCDPSANNTNTLVGLITFYKTRMGLGVLPATDTYSYLPSPLLPVSTSQSASSPTLPTGHRDATARNLHWWFYNNQSEHLIDGGITVTDNDFVRFDWCTTLRDRKATSLYGIKGYLLFGQEEPLKSSPIGVPSFALYGHAYQITGNWASMAFIPVLANPVYSFEADPVTPTTVTVGGQAQSVTRNVDAATGGGAPHIRRLVVGTDFTDLDVNGVIRNRDIYARYFLDPALASKNETVFWFNTNDAKRIATNGDTYNSEEVQTASWTMPLPYELNVLTSTPTTPATDGKYTIFGLYHSETEPADPVTGATFTVVNTGILRFPIPEQESTLSYVSSGVSFQLISLGASTGGNTSQVQTELTTEGAAY